MNNSHTEIVPVIYHKDNNKFDPRWDSAIKLGRIAGQWTDELDRVIKHSEPRTFNGHQPMLENLGPPSRFLFNDDFGSVRTDQGTQTVIGRVISDLTPSFQKICNLFSLEDAFNKINVQLVGEVFPTHTDRRLARMCQTNPEEIVRFTVMLTDWQQGHFWHWGNYNWSHWSAGDVVQHDWVNTPHGTANSNDRWPRVSLTTTGRATDDTYKFLEQLKTQSEYTL